VAGYPAEYWILQIAGYPANLLTDLTGYPAFRLAEYPVKEVSGASLLKSINNLCIFRILELNYRLESFFGSCLLSLLLGSGLGKQSRKSVTASFLKKSIKIACNYLKVGRYSSVPNRS
jgi:hypothetical protein